MEDLDFLWLAITKIEAQKTLVDTQVSGWAYMKKADREKIHRKLIKQAYGDQEEKVVVTNAEELARFIMGA